MKFGEEMRSVINISRARDKENLYGLPYTGRML